MSPSFPVPPPFDEEKLLGKRQDSENSLGGLKILCYAGGGVVFLFSMMMLMETLTNPTATPPNLPDLKAKAPPDAGDRVIESLAKEASPKSSPYDRPGLPDMYADRPAKTADHTGELLAGLLGILLVVCGIACYFAPLIIAVNRNHPNTAPIAVVNIFLGWTLVGWVVALAWSLMAIDRKPHTEVAKLL